jgi:uncharacterized membrane protein SirB2
MDYATLLSIHSAAVGISLGLFLLRGVWLMNGSAMLARKWVRIVPHINDTVLIAAAIGMLVVAGLNPLEHGWIMAKIVALLAYIALGTIALKRGKTPLQSKLAFVGALAVFGYIVAVAVTKQVVPI